MNEHIWEYSILDEKLYLRRQEASIENFEIIQRCVDLTIDLTEQQKEQIRTMLKMRLF